VTKARWPYWDVLAFGAGALPFLFVIFADTFGTRGDALFLFAGSLGTLAWLAVWACVPLVLVGALMGWRIGNRLLIIAGSLFLAISMAPVLLLFFACAFGSCI
jgi:hypothetical protein